MRARVPYAVSVAVTTSTAAPRYSWLSTYFVPLGRVPDSLADEDAARPPGQCALRVVEVDVQVVGPGNGGTGDLHGVLAVTEAVGQLGNPAVGALGRGGITQALANSTPVTPWATSPVGWRPADCTAVLVSPSASSAQ